MCFMACCVSHFLILWNNYISINMESQSSIKASELLHFDREGLCCSGVDGEQTMQAHGTSGEASGIMQAS